MHRRIRPILLLSSQNPEPLSRLFGRSAGLLEPRTGGPKEQASGSASGSLKERFERFARLAKSPAPLTDSRTVPGAPQEATSTDFRRLYLWDEASCAGCRHRLGP